MKLVEPESERKSGDFKAEYEGSIPFTRSNPRFSTLICDFVRSRSLDGSVRVFQTRGVFDSTACQHRSGLPLRTDLLTARMVFGSGHEFISYFHKSIRNQLPNRMTSRPL